MTGASSALASAEPVPLQESTSADGGAPSGTSRLLLSIGALQALGMVVALARAKGLSVLLGPARFGVTSTIDQTVLTLVNLGALSLPFTALKFMARGHSEGAETFQRMYASFFRALAMLGAATTTIALAVLVARPAAFGAQMSAYRGALVIAVLGVPAAVLNILFVNVLAAARRPAAAALVGLWSAVGLAAGAIVGELARGLPGLYVGTMIAGVATTVATMAYLRRALGLRPWRRPAALLAELRRTPEIVSYSMLVYLVMAAYSLTMLRARYVVLSDYGASAAGLLQALLSLALAVGAVMGPMSNLFFTPLVNRSVAVAVKATAAADFAGTMSVMLCLAALPLVLFPRLAVTMLFSGRFVGAADVLFVFLAWQCAYQLANVYLQLLVGVDDVAWFTLATVVGYVAVVGLFEVLVPRFGLAGAGAALAVGVGVMGTAAAMRLRVRFACAIPPAVLVRGGFCLGSIVAGGLTFAGRPEQTLGGVLGRLAYALLVGAGLWTLLTPDERRRALGTIARLRVGRRAVRARAA